MPETTITVRMTHKEYDEYCSMILHLPRGTQYERQLLHHINALGAQKDELIEAGDKLRKWACPGDEFCWRQEAEAVRQAISAWEEAKDE